MATVEDIQKLAALARIKVADSELKKFTSEFHAILAYVGQLEKLELPKNLMGERPPLRNVMRADGEPHVGGRYTKKIVEQFSARSSSAEATEDKEGGYLVVKQIITHE